MSFFTVKRTGRKNKLETKDEEEDEVKCDTQLTEDCSRADLVVNFSIVPEATAITQSASELTRRNTEVKYFTEKW